MLFIIIICIMSVFAAEGAGAGACMTTVVGAAAGAAGCTAATGAAATGAGATGATATGAAATGAAATGAGATGAAAGAAGAGACIWNCIPSVTPAGTWTCISWPPMSTCIMPPGWTPGGTVTFIMDIFAKLETRGTSMSEPFLFLLFAVRALTFFFDNGSSPFALTAQTPSPSG